MKKLNGKPIFAAKEIYLCLLTVYAILREMLAIQNLVGSSLITYGFFGAGMAIAMGCALVSPKPYIHRSQWLPLGFLAICVISTGLNLQFELMSNIKAIAWMALYFFLLLPGGWDAEKEDKCWRRVMWTAVITLFAMAFFSLPMYFFDVDYFYVKETGFVNNQGFSREFMRLWGLYNDANTAGVYSLVGMCMAAYLFTQSKKRLTRIFLIYTEVVLFLMMVLTNSRTALVALVVAAAWIAGYCLLTRIRLTLWKRLGFTVVGMAVALAVTLGLCEAVKWTVPYVKVGVKSLTTESVNGAIHRGYDRLYQKSDLNITEGYYVEPGTQKPEPDATEPDATEPVATEPVATEPGTTEPVETKPSAPVVESLDRQDKKEDLSNGRFQKWSEVMEVVRYKPIFGASPRGISAAAKQVAPQSTVARFGFAAHNSMLEVLAGTGAVGFVIVLVILVLVAWKILRAAFTAAFCWKTLLYSTVLLMMMCEMMFISDVFFGMTFGGVAFWLSAGRMMEPKKKKE